MGKPVPLLVGAYEARSVIADAQRCVNLYPEINPKDSEEPVTHYPTPGLEALGTPPAALPFRELFFSSTSDLYGVVGSTVYYIDKSWNYTSLGNILTGGSTPVKIWDNGQTAFVVDGSPSGFLIDLVTKVMTPYNDPSFLGSNFADYSDTFMLFNLPGTQQFYSTLSNTSDIDPTYFAAKSGAPDILVGIKVMHEELWLIGQRTTEVWYDSGGAQFPWQRLSGVFIEQGCCATYSIVKHGLNVFWLGQDKDGNREVIMGEPYKVSRISTHAVEYALNKYSKVSDCIGMTYQQEGHIFYILTFPSANVTWVYDIRTGMWHERVWTNNNGQENRIRASCMTFAYDTLVCGDHSTGQLYKMNLDNYTDNGQPITRRRGFPHLVAGGTRALYRSFIADIECGNQDPADSSKPPQISLRWSDDRGRSWSNPIEQSLGAGGQYLTQPKWNRLGLARDRVFELFWSPAQKTALNGAWVDSTPVRT